jgi:hypothetical protein
MFGSSSGLHIENLIYEFVSCVPVQQRENAHCQIARWPPYGDNQSGVPKAIREVLLEEQFEIAPVVRDQDSVLTAGKIQLVAIGRAHASGLYR